jgi:hypothetical protein
VQRRKVLCLAYIILDAVALDLPQLFVDLRTCDRRDIIKVRNGTFREYRVRSWPVRSALRMRGSSLSSSKSALMSVIAASCCTEESFESSSKKPITDDTADEIASDMMGSAREAKVSTSTAKMPLKIKRAKGSSAPTFTGVVRLVTCGRGQQALRSTVRTPFPRWRVERERKRNLLVWRGTGLTRLSRLTKVAHKQNKID